MSNRSAKQERIKGAHRRNRKRQRDDHAGRARWRSAPATQKQIHALQKIAMETGHTFDVGVTRGEAWRRIRETTTLLSAATRTACAPPWHA